MELLQIKIWTLTPVWYALMVLGLRTGSAPHHRDLWDVWREKAVEKKVAMPRGLHVGIWWLRTWVEVWVEVWIHSLSVYFMCDMAVTMPSKGNVVSPAGIDLMHFISHRCGIFPPDVTTHRINTEIHRDNSLAGYIGIRLNFTLLLLLN